MSEGGIVLDVSEMKGLDIDVDGRTAWAESGLTAAEYTAAVGAHGLATGFGDTGSVGIGGITLGGGVGYLVRKFGLTIDDLLARRDRHRRRAAPRGGRRAPSRPVLGDPRWRRQLRRRHPLPLSTPRAARDRRRDADPACHRRTPSPGSSRRPRRRRTSCRRSPTSCPAHRCRSSRPSVTASSSSWPSSRMRATPRPGSGRSRRSGHWPTPVADLLRPMTYPEIYPPEDPDYHPTAAARTLFIDRVDREVADDHRVPARGRRRRSFCAVQLRVLGGAMARVPADATAFAHRASRIMVNVAAFFEGPDDQVVQRGLGERGRRRARAGRSRRLRQLRRRRRTRSASGRPIRARPWTGWRRSRPATTRPTCSTSTRTWLLRRQAGTSTETAAPGPGRRPPAGGRQASSTPAARASSASDSSASSVVVVAWSRPITRLMPASR